MKFLCIRTYFREEIGDTRWSKNKVYSGREPSSIERESGIMCYIDSDLIGPGGSPVQYFVVEKTYDRHFRPLDEVRNEKIEKILGIEY